MFVIEAPKDCGNAPKKQFLVDYQRALAEKDLDFLSNHLSARIKWEIVGEMTISGKEEFLKHISETKFGKAQHLVVETVITHGTDAALSGRLTTADGGIYHFCEVYKFKGFKGFELASIKSYFVEATPEQSQQ